MVRKLNATDLEAFRALLLSIRFEITGDIGRLEQDAFGIDGEKAAPDRRAEGGSDAFFQDFSLELLELDGSTLEEVDMALERIREGVYGLCVECDGALPKARLRALPYAPCCVECQRGLEQAG